MNLDELERLAQRLHSVVVTGGLADDDYVAAAVALTRLIAVVRAADAMNLEMSRVLHEMAGSVSLCWIPKPTGEFDSTQACEFVAEAIEELRAPLRAARAQLEQP